MEMTSSCRNSRPQVTASWFRQGGLPARPCGDGGGRRRGRQSPSHRAGVPALQRSGPEPHSAAVQGGHSRGGARLKTMRAKRFCACRAPARAAPSAGYQATVGKGECPVRDSGSGTTARRRWSPRRREARTSGRCRVAQKSRPLGRGLRELAVTPPLQHLDTRQAQRSRRHPHSAGNRAPGHIHPRSLPETPE